jgi:hypothetical protein
MYGVRMAHLLQGVVTGDAGWLTFWFDTTVEAQHLLLYERIRCIGIEETPKRFVC